MIGHALRTAPVLAAHLRLALECDEAGGTRHRTQILVHRAPRVLDLVAEDVLQRALAVLLGRGCAPQRDP